jgi:hypothetical protein
MARLYGPLEACLEPVSGQRGRVSTPASSAEGQAKRRHRGARPRRVMTLSDAPGRGSWAGLRAGTGLPSLEPRITASGVWPCGVPCSGRGVQISRRQLPLARVRDAAKVSVSAATPGLLHHPLQRSTAASRGRRPWPRPSHSRLRH